MVLKKGDLVKIDYTAVLQETGKVFDTTVEEVARKENIYSPKVRYSPMVVLLGEEALLKGLGEGLLGCSEGEEKKLVLPPEKAFGERKQDLVRVVPLKQFRSQGVTPVAGMVLNLDGMRARIKSVSGGRVVVDFNHELAGRTLVYDVRVVSLAKSREEKAGFLFEKAFNFECEKAEFGSEGLLVSVKGLNPARQRFARMIYENLGEKKTSFLDKYSVDV